MNLTAVLLILMGLVALAYCSSQEQRGEKQSSETGITGIVLVTLGALLALVVAA